jgi:hypothetical protein
MSFQISAETQLVTELIDLPPSRLVLMLLLIQNVIKLWLVLFRKIMDKEVLKTIMFSASMVCKRNTMNFKKVLKLKKVKELKLLELQDHRVLNQLFSKFLMKILKQVKHHLRKLKFNLMLMFLLVPS